MLVNKHVKEKTNASGSDEHNCKSIRKLLIQRGFHKPLASSRLCRLGLDPRKLEAILSLPFNKTSDTTLSMFQCKIIHDTLPYGRKLFMIKIVNSPLCIHCNSVETLSHILLDCKAV